MITNIAEMFRGGRPAVIISNDIGNNAGPVLEIVYLTTQEKKPLPTHVKINICMKTWDVVRKLEWKEKCDPAENEELLLWNLY